MSEPQNPVKPIVWLDADRMACRGAATQTVWSSTGDMEECGACGTRIAWDRVNHPVIGFQVTCPFRAVPIVEASPAPDGGE